MAQLPIAANHIDRLKDIRVLVAGDAMLDHYVVGEVERISPEAPVPVLRVREETFRLGGAANVAANVVALGGKANLLCLVGGTKDGAPDEDAKRISDLCDKAGIDGAGMPLLPRTTRKARMIAAKQQMLRVDWDPPYTKGDTGHALDEQGSPLLGQETRAFRLDRTKQLVDDCQIILVSDYAKGMIDKDFMDILRASGKPVVIDPRPLHTEHYRGVTLITPNRKEAAQMAGLDPARDRPPEELGRRLAARLKCAVLVTLGPEGMCLVQRDGEAERIPTRAREVFDVTGAGDTVAATAALALGAGLNLTLAAHLANAAAGLVVAHFGTASVTPKELRESLRRA